MGIYNQALRYHELGLPIIPLCPPDHAGMSATHREECKAPGKAPIIAGWQHRGLPSSGEIVKWWENTSNNIGLVLGDTGEYNIVGIDVDGSIGEELLEEHAQGVLPPTWEYATGNGRRLLYMLPEGAASKKVTKKGDDGELAFLATGQQTVLPPSKHHTGRNYIWKEGRSPEDIDIADAPQWVINEVIIRGTSEAASLIPKNAKQTVDESDWTKSIGKGQRNDHITKLAGSLIARRNIPKEQILEFLYQWNENHCDPPLPKQEIDVMVENLHKSEMMKHEKIKKEKQEKQPLRPIVFVQKFMENQNEQGVDWHYSVSRGMFYTCDTTTGPWEKIDDLFVQKEIRKELIGENPGWDSHRNVGECLHALREYLADPRKDDIFDLGLNGDVDNIFLNNGILNADTLELKEWDTSSYSTIKLKANWDPDAKDSQEYQYWKETLALWIPDDATRMFLQEYIGYCLLPDPSFRTAVFLYGAGSNGKSLFLDVISKLFEGYISFIPMHWIGERFESVNLMDKLINVCGDIDSTYMKETATLKALISGDAIRAEVKHGKSFHFYPVARLIFTANQLPKAADKSEGWYSRWKFVQFPRQFKVNPKFKRELLNTMSSSEALSALLCWAVEGLQRLRENGEFTESIAMEDSKSEYKAENDSVFGFLEQCVKEVGTEGQKTTITVPSLYHTYKSWCDEVGLKAVSRNEFVRRARQIGYKKQPRKVNGVSAQCFVGVVFTEYAKGLGLVEEYNFQEAIRSTSKN